MAKAFTEEDDALLAELGVEEEAKKGTGRTVREEQIIAGFEDIQRFVTEHGHVPQHGEKLDIFERLYAIRLDRLRAQADCLTLLAPLDRQGLLAGAGFASVGIPDDIDDDELLAQLGVDATGDIAELKHVRSAAEKRAAEEIANRESLRGF